MKKKGKKGKKGRKGNKGKKKKSMYVIENDYTLVAHRSIQKITFFSNHFSKPPGLATGSSHRSYLPLAFSHSMVAIKSRLLAMPTPTPSACAIEKALSEEKRR